ncbi:MAG: hypothetical protein V3T70_05750, partial [Phycisphaerae bacterium]
AKTTPGLCGCGVPGIDTDGDGIGDACPPPPAAQGCSIPLCGLGGFGMIPWMIGGMWVMRRRVRRGRPS